MPIKRSSIEIVDFNDEEFKDSDEKNFCPDCKDYGFQVPLRNRIYPEGEQVPEDERAKWKMCFDCGLIVPVYELERESKIKDTVDTVESPFELGSDFLGVDSRKLGKKKKKDKDMELDYIKDEQLKQELRHGSTLLNYSEHIP